MIVRVGAGETALVGYGLLVSPATVDATLGHEYSGPHVACHVEGWRRSWDVTMPNASFYYERDGHRVYPEKILYLNVRRDPGTMMNCEVFVVDNEDLAAVNAREWIYDGVVATPDLRGVRVEGGDALIYTGKAEHIVRSAARASDVAIRRSYRIGDMTDLDLQPGTFDVVLCVLGLFFVDDMPGLVRSLWELLRPGGRLVITVLGDLFFAPMLDVFVDAVHAERPGFDVVEPWRRTEDPHTIQAIMADAGVPGVGDPKRSRHHPDPVQ